MPVCISAPDKASCMHGRAEQSRAEQGRAGPGRGTQEPRRQRTSISCPFEIHPPHSAVTRRTSGPWNYPRVIGGHAKTPPFFLACLEGRSFRGRWTDMMPRASQMTICARPLVVLCWPGYLGRVLGFGIRARHLPNRGAVGRRSPTPLARLVASARPMTLQHSTTCTQTSHETARLGHSRALCAALASG